MKAVVISCPRCGSSYAHEVASGLEARCDLCGAEFRIDDLDGVPSFILRLLQTEEERQLSGDDTFDADPALEADTVVGEVPAGLRGELAELPLLSEDYDEFALEKQEQPASPGSPAAAPAKGPAAPRPSPVASAAGPPPSGGKLAAEPSRREKPGQPSLREVAERTATAAIEEAADQAASEAVKAATRPAPRKSGRAARPPGSPATSPRGVTQDGAAAPSTAAAKAAARVAAARAAGKEVAAKGAPPPPKAAAAAPRRDAPGRGQETRAATPGAKAKGRPTDQPQDTASGKVRVAPGAGRADDRKGAGRKTQAATPGAKAKAKVEAAGKKPPQATPSRPGRRDEPDALPPPPVALEDESPIDKIPEAAAYLSARDAGASGRFEVSGSLLLPTKPPAAPGVPPPLGTGLQSGEPDAPTVPGVAPRLVTEVDDDILVVEEEEEGEVDRAPVLGEGLAAVPRTGRRRGAALWVMAAVALGGLALLIVLLRRGTSPDAQPETPATPAAVAVTAPVDAAPGVGFAGRGTAPAAVSAAAPGVTGVVVGTGEASPPAAVAAGADAGAPLDAGATPEQLATTADAGTPLVAAGRGVRRWGRRRAGGRRRRVPVVVDYEPPRRAAPPQPPRARAEPAPTKAPEGADAPREPDLAAAREAYRQARQRHWYGDFAAAERLYRQSLREYPGYAAGVRGLGLLHARRGDRPRAIRAFTRYLRMAPKARDAPQIRARLKKLSGE